MRSMPRRGLVWWLAVGLGSGLAPRAPGTAGTLVAAGLYLALLQHLPLAWQAAVVGVSGVAGIWLCGRAARQMGVHDHPAIVWDEFVGYWLTMLAAPPGWGWALVGLVLFRVFDIGKPWPIGWLDRRVGGGSGIMLDDVLAGLYSAALLALLAKPGLLTW